MWKIIDKIKEDWKTGVPDWAWNITYAIMASGVLLNLILLLMRLGIL